MLLRAVVLVCLAGTSFALLGFNIRGNAPWFQNLNFGQNAGNNRIRDTFMNGVLRGKNSPCNGTGGMALSEGICKPSLECRKEGGTPSGTCALVGSCCIKDYTCGNTTAARISYFSSRPGAVPPTCALTVRLANRNVCQIRLDFDLFEIADVAGINAVDVPNVCLNDTFTVTGASNTNLGFDSLCGVNTGQHIYIPVNNTINNAIMLNFALQTLNRTGLAPTWRIKITQLECERSAQDFSSQQSALTNLYEKFQKKKAGTRTDRNLIAPPGCLQYYPEPSGTYSSFNYNNGQGRMIANTNYAICFRRQMATCGIQHTAQNFLMADPGEPTGTDTGALSCRNETAGNGDWLFIPGVSVSTDNGPRQDYLCGVDLGQVISTTAGPLYVGVRTDGEDDGTTSQFIQQTSGFQIAYNTLTSGCVPSVAPTTPTSVETTVSSETPPGRKRPFKG